MVVGSAIVPIVAPTSSRDNHKLYACIRTMYVLRTIIKATNTASLGPLPVAIGTCGDHTGNRGERESEAQTRDPDRPQLASSRWSICQAPAATGFPPPATAGHKGAKYSYYMSIRSMYVRSSRAFMPCPLAAATTGKGTMTDAANPRSRKASSPFMSRCTFNVLAKSANALNHIGRTHVVLGGS